jgi:Phage tail tube protein, GTA-gp10
MNHIAYFGDGEKTFALTPELIHELERKAGVGVLSLYRRFTGMHVYFADIIEVIRLGLIGGGMSPAEAQKLVDAYAKPRPVMEVLPLAFDILEAKMSGGADPAPSPNAQDELRQAAATGDLAAGINQGTGA